MLLLKQCISVYPGDEGHPPVAPLPPPLGPPLALLPVHAVPDVDEEGGMGGDPGHNHGRDDVPDLTPGVEEGMEGPDPGGDVTGHARGPTTETEIERGTETETGTGDDTQHAGERGRTPNVSQQLLIYTAHDSDSSSLFVYCQVPLQLTTGGQLEARGSKQWRTPAGRQQ